MNVKRPRPMRFGRVMAPLLTIPTCSHRPAAIAPDDHDITPWSETFSWEMYLGVGTSHRAGKHNRSFELGISLGLEGVGGDDGMADVPRSGLGESKTRLLPFSAGIQL